MAEEKKELVKQNPIKALEQAVAAAKSVKDLLKIDVVSERYIANYQAFSGRSDGRERFERDSFAFMEIANNKPEILECDPFSIFAGFIKTAAYGIPIQSKKWSIYPRNVKIKDGWKKNLVVDLDAHGKKEALEKMDSIKRIDDGVVIFKTDEFRYDPKNKKVIKHELVDFPSPKASKENIKGAYCTVHFTDGRSEDVLLTVAEIETARAKSPAPDGPAWGQSYGEMCKKSTYNRAFKIYYRTPDTAVLYRQFDVDAAPTQDIPHEDVELPTPEPEVPENVDTETGEEIKPVVVEPVIPKDKKPEDDFLAGMK